MSQEDLQNKYDRLFLKVSNMRHFQKRWFKYNVRDDLDKAKRLEREVDVLIVEDNNKKQSNAQELF